MTQVCGAQCAPVALCLCRKCVLLGESSGLESYLAPLHKPTCNACSLPPGRTPGPSRARSLRLHLPHAFPVSQPCRVSPRALSGLGPGCSCVSPPLRGCKFPGSAFTLLSLQPLPSHLLCHLLCEVLPGFPLPQSMSPVLCRFCTSQAFLAALDSPLASQDQPCRIPLS